jgi:hypothetical protein
MHTLNAADLIFALFNLTCTMAANCDAAFLLSHRSFTDCDKETSNGCEINTMNNTQNCGGCGTSATRPNANTICSNGKVVLVSCFKG